MESKEARKILQENMVLIAPEDNRPAIQIVADLGLAAIRTEIQPTEQTSGIIEQNE